MASGKRCHYEVLGLNLDSTADEIRSAYRKLALQRHPDKLVKYGFSQSDATAQFQELQQAYEVLSDPTERAWYDSLNPAPDVSAASGDHVPESSNLHEEAEGHSIYVRNLPFDATVEQLDEEFKKFGQIKRDGIQVRSNKQGFCFGFVEFEQLSSVHAALEASPISIGDRQAVVEEKRTTTRVSGSGRGRFRAGRGFRSDSFRARGNCGGGRGYGRNEFRNQGEFSGRPRGSTGRNGEGYQRANQNGGGRGGGRQGQGGANRSAGGQSV